MDSTEAGAGLLDHPDERFVPENLPSGPDEERIGNPSPQMQEEAVQCRAPALLIGARSPEVLGAEEERFDLEAQASPPPRRLPETLHCASPPSPASIGAPGASKGELAVQSSLGVKLS